MTAVLAREAFGAKFVGADGFLNTPTYGLPPRFLIDADVRSPRMAAPGS